MGSKKRPFVDLAFGLKLDPPTLENGFLKLGQVFSWVRAINAT